MATAAIHAVMVIAVVIDHWGKKSWGGLALAVIDRVAIVAKAQAGTCLVVVIALDMSTREQDLKWTSRAGLCTRSRAYPGRFWRRAGTGIISFSGFSFCEQRSVLLMTRISWRS